MIGERALVTVLLGGMLFMPYIILEIIFNIIVIFGVKFFCNVFQRCDNTDFANFLKGLKKLAILRLNLFPIVALTLDIINFAISRNRTVYSDFWSVVNNVYVDTSIWFWIFLLLIAVLASTYILIRHYYLKTNGLYKPKLILIIMIISSSIIGLVFSFQGTFMFWAT
ncbi:hypothetical protein [Clostridium sp. JNZ J1-5]